MCLRVSSALDAPLPRTTPIRSRSVRHVDVLTTKYLIRLLIGLKAPEAFEVHYTETPHPGEPRLYAIGRIEYRFGSNYCQPFLWRSPVMCAAWCRPCQA